MRSLLGGKSRCSWCGPTSGNPAFCCSRSIRAPATAPPPVGRRQSPVPQSRGAGFHLGRGRSSSCHSRKTPAASYRIAACRHRDHQAFSDRRVKMSTYRLGALMEPMTPDSVKWFDVWIEFQLFRFADLRIVTGARRTHEIYRGYGRRFPILIVLCIVAISLGGCFEGPRATRAIRVRQGRRGLKASKARRGLRGYREKTARMEYRARPAQQCGLCQIHRPRRLRLDRMHFGMCDGRDRGFGNLSIERRCHPAAQHPDRRRLDRILSDAIHRNGAALLQEIAAASFTSLSAAPQHLAGIVPMALR